MSTRTPGPAGDPRTPPGLATTLPAATPELVLAALNAAAEPIVLCATDHTVLLVNAAAQALVPGLAPGETLTAAPLPELAAAAAEDATTFRSEHHDRFLYGLRRPLGAGHYAWYLRDRTDEQQRTAALEAERARATFLADAGRHLSASLNLRRVRRTTAELAAGHLADAAVVILPPHRRQSSWTRMMPGHPAEEGTLPEHGLAEIPGLREVIDGFPPIPSRWLDPAQAPGWLLPAALGPIGALLVTPLPGNAAPAGALVLARLGAGATFSEQDEALVRVFAARAGAALAAAALYRDQVDTAAVLQADLLPPELPQADGFELAGSYQAAFEALQVGGDFYEVFGPSGANTDTLVALGDVCGTGPEAAVLTGKVRQTLRALRLMRARPDAMLRVLNQAMLESGRKHRFVTLLLGSITRAEHGRVRIGLVSGGHPPPLVLRTDGSVEEVPAGGTLLGVLPVTTVHPATVELAPGELCLLHTDGLTEARGGPSGHEEFGEARLRQALSACAGLPGPVTLERLRQLVSDWVHGGTTDDIAMLTVRAPARPPLSLRGGGAPNQSPYLMATRRADRRARPRA
ncbi:hypothetical protein GCM10010168_82250 [Actinoplanes ianthinogenes]|uniref:PPM-type phosphatase domain-containing protein n=1 Tax=Actinoplanes ianthinogenes TaxID=122358 RepID=A0ABM7LMD7_9ACTN|nr:PP2C family protein-serine/threonine phosphatase [Actinoplanes ianthinogenes]BCJ40441.1 hypothetical protein Aiant_10980 [Actinoplanes ianthinogenes]GGR50862.1 hypothetical protein GCM10010168_82250 [Actinoplanes ianthinogenes]